MSLRKILLPYIERFGHEAFFSQNQILYYLKICTFSYPTRFLTFYKYLKRVGLETAGSKK